MPQWVQDHSLKKENINLENHLYFTSNVSTFYITIVFFHGLGELIYLVT